MELSKEIYQALQSIVGSEHISDDHVICEADTRGGYGEFVFDKDAVSPACVVLPGSTEEVREIVKLANRYRLPFVPVSTNYTALCAPTKPFTIMMDLKRMERLEIDAKNMYAIAEPGVSISQLQVEAMKRGLYTLTPGCGSQASVVANTTDAGVGPLGYRLGYAHRRILAVEWVLPNGEMLKLGSRAMLRDYFWGEGPGPDLRGLLRGVLGWHGGLGVVTKMAVKLFPFVPERLEPTGVSPNTTLKLPINRMKWFNITYPSTEKAVAAMYEISRNEIGALLMTVPPIWRYVARARGKGANEFWEMWNKATETIKPEETIVRILLIGYTSERQLAYEERVLQDIAAESGGAIREGRPVDESWLISADAISIFFIGGAELSVELSQDSLDQGLKLGRAIAEERKGYTPPLAQDYGPGWLYMSEFGHMGYLEFLAYTDPENADILTKWGLERLENDIKVGAYPTYTDPNILGSAWHNYHILLNGIKQLFDPYNISNPPRPALFKPAKQLASAPRSSR
jgi:hypothetical protein